MVLLPPPADTLLCLVHVNNPKAYSGRIWKERFGQDETYQTFQVAGRDRRINAALRLPSARLAL